MRYRHSSRCTFGTRKRDHEKTSIAENQRRCGGHQTQVRQGTTRNMQHGRSQRAFKKENLEARASRNTKPALVYSHTQDAFGRMKPHQYTQHAEQISLPPLQQQKHTPSTKKVSTKLITPFSVRILQKKIKNAFTTTTTTLNSPTMLTFSRPRDAARVPPTFSTSLDDTEKRLGRRRERHQHSNRNHHHHHNNNIHITRTRQDPKGVLEKGTGDRGGR